MMKKIIILIILLVSNSVNATFTLSGTTITQTGTDNNLSGLSGISGVTVSSQADIDLYNIGNRRLIIQGTLTIDPEKETLFIGYNSGDLVQVLNGAHLIIGKEILLNGFTRYSEGLAIYLDDSGSGFINRFTFQNGGNLTWNGGIISMEAGKFGFYGDNCTVRINSTNAKLIYRTTNSQNQIRQQTDDFISTGFDFIGGDLTIVGTGQQLNGYRPTHCSGAIAFSSATPNVDIIVRDYAGGGRGNTIDVKFWAGGRPYLINSESGTELNTGPHISGNGGSYGVLRVFQELSLNVSEFGAGGINGAKLYFQDYNNGNRRLYNQESPAIDLTNTFTYTGTSDANGDIASQEILIGDVIADTSFGLTSSSVNSGLYAWDYRSKNGNTTDLFDMYIASYNHFILTLSDVELKGAGGTQLHPVMFVDDLITETSKATVAAYSTIDTVEKLYDSAKSYLIDNYAGETETIVTRSKEIIDARAYNIVVDAAAANVFAFDGTTITIKATEFKGNLSTTGTVTLANGATIYGGYIEDDGSGTPETNKFIDVTWDDNSTNDIKIINLDDNSEIYSFTGATSGFRNHFIAPNPAPTNGVEFRIVSQSGTNPILYSEKIPDEDLDYLRFDISVSGETGLLTEQYKILRLLERTLAKTTAIKDILDDVSTPNINVTNNLATGTGNKGTKQNQEAMKLLLTRILNKVSANREAFKE